MRYPNLIWAISESGTRYKFAARIGGSESWLSRRLSGRAEFSPEDRKKISQILGYPADWLFATPNPPSRETEDQLEQAGVAA